MHFTITSEDILWLAAAILTLWGVVKAYREFNKPNVDLHDQVEANTKHLDIDNKRLNQIEDDNRIICKSLMVLINHEITGNGIETMKEIRDELQDYIITK